MHNPTSYSNRKGMLGWRGMERNELLILLFSNQMTLGRFIKINKIIEIYIIVVSFYFIFVARTFE